MQIAQPTRRVVSPGGVWVPRPYQQRAVSHLLERGVAALFIAVGLGKTAIVLEAFRRLKESGVAERMLVVAPLRVVQSVWRQEGQKWEQFRDLTFSVLHGSKKDAALAAQADVYLINPEGVAWLAGKYAGRPLPFDTVVIDELPKFKNARAERSKALRPRLSRVARRWGLTGTPASNGYMDLFGQMLILDDGAALGRYITHFRDKYFRMGYNGFDYTLIEGAEKLIEERLRPYALRMSAEEYLTLPPVCDNVIDVPLDKAARAAYVAMRDEAVAALNDSAITAANAAAVYTKLRQIANGAVYDEDGAVHQIHDAKLDALEELIDELAGQPLLIAYEFRHDLARMQKRFGDKLHVIGSGQTETRTNETIDAWNHGRISLLAAHPASAGHGLNLQGSGCGNICWFGPTWDLELYSQFIGRVHRSGNTALRIVNHILCAENSIDGLVIKAVKDKDTTQNRLLCALSDATGIKAETKEKTEMMTSSRTGNAQPRKLPWPGVADTDEHAEAVDAQRHRIQAKINPVAAPAEEEEEPPLLKYARENPPQVQKYAAFSSAVRAQAAETVAALDAASSVRENAKSEAPSLKAKRAARAPEEKKTASSDVKLEILKLAFSDPGKGLDESLILADEMLRWYGAN